MKRPFALAFAGGLWTATAPFAAADIAARGADGPPANSGAGTFTFQFENDKFAGTDRHYTNGIRFSWISDAITPELQWARDVMGWLYPFAFDTRARIGIVLGQSMFTPSDIAATELIVDDRPYAGWLYAGLTLNVEAKQVLFDTKFDVLDAMELDVGIVGPQSYAEQTQKLVHEIMGVQRPNGWGNQLKNEPGVALALERKWRMPIASRDGIDTDAIPGLGVSVGNVDTSASLGALFRAGQGLTVDYGPPHIRPNLTGLSFIERIPDRFAWYLFVGAAGRVVVRNIFLDGNTFADSHRVDKNYLVGDFQAGAAVVIDRVRLSFSYLVRTNEFEGQNGFDRFGAISLSVRF